VNLAAQSRFRYGEKKAEYPFRARRAKSIVLGTKSFHEVIYRSMQRSHTHLEGTSEVTVQGRVELSTSGHNWHSFKGKICIH
jgi:hypothetical protein